MDLPPFEEPGVASWYQQLLQAAQARSWKGGTLARRGSQLSRRWTMGSPGSKKSIAINSGRMKLGVYAPSNPKQSHGISWSSEQAGADFSVQVSLSVGGTGITPDHVQIKVTDSERGQATFGAPLSWKLGNRSLSTRRPEGLQAVQARLALYNEGRSALEAAALSDFQALEAVVLPVLASADYTLCDWGPSPGRGIPGPCLPRSPTTEEQRALRQGFLKEMAMRREVLRARDWSVLLLPNLPKLP